MTSLARFVGNEQLVNMQMELKHLFGVQPFPVPALEKEKSVQMANDGFPITMFMSPGSSREHGVINNNNVKRAE